MSDRWPARRRPAGRGRPGGRRGTSERGPPAAACSVGACAGTAGGSCRGEDRCRRRRLGVRPRPTLGQIGELGDVDAHPSCGGARQHLDVGGHDDQRQPRTEPLALAGAGRGEPPGEIGGSELERRKVDGLRAHGTWHREATDDLPGLETDDGARSEDLERGAWRRHQPAADRVADSHLGLQRRVGARRGRTSGLTSAGSTSPRAAPVAGCTHEAKRSVVT